jgi:Ca-activated chloride channel family protein
VVIRWVLLLALLLLPTGSVMAEEEIYVLIVEPQLAAPLFGEVDLVAEVSPSGLDARVEFFVDGEKVGEAEAPPYRVTIDVGEENREHEVRVRAVASSGASAEALVVTPAIPIDDVVHAELQQLYVTVLDGSRRVLDLVEEDFEIRDNGVGQQMVTFAAGHVPLAAAVLIDASASMRGRGLRFALRGARVFAEGVLPEDEVSIQLFADRLLFESPFSGDASVSTAGLGGSEAEGGTALNDHLYRSLRQLEARQGRRVVVLLSDGIDSHSVLRMRDVVWLSRRSRAMIYWIRTDPWVASKDRFSAWKSPSEYRAEYYLLEETVAESGGRIITLESIEQAESAVGEILAELREQYVLGYYPTDSRDDGSWHRVHVDVRRAGVAVRARGGYIDY